MSQSQQQVSKKDRRAEMRQAYMVWQAGSTRGAIELGRLASEEVWLGCSEQEDYGQATFRQLVAEIQNDWRTALDSTVDVTRLIKWYSLCLVAEVDTQGLIVSTQCLRRLERLLSYSDSASESECFFACDESRAKFVAKALAAKKPWTGSQAVERINREFPGTIKTREADESHGETETSDDTQPEQSTRVVEFADADARDVARAVSQWLASHDGQARLELLKELAQIVRAHAVETSKPSAQAVRNGQPVRAQA